MSALSWQSLRVDYDGQIALDLGPVDLSGGQLIALLGPNGSGKSSLFKALIGAIPSSSDALKLGGELIDNLSRQARARRLAYLSQARTGPALATVQDIVALGRTPHGGTDPEGRIDVVIQHCDLQSLTSRRFGTLSGGEQARVLLARTMAVGADIILVDEPTAALDPYYALGLMETLRHEAKRGALVIVSLHTLDLAQRYADQIIVLNEGKIAAQGPSKDALNPTVLREVFRVQNGQEGLTPLKD